MLNSIIVGTTWQELTITGKYKNNSSVCILLEVSETLPSSTDKGILLGRYQDIIIPNNGKKYWAKTTCGETKLTKIIEDNSRNYLIGDYFTLAKAGVKEFLLISPDSDMVAKFVSGWEPTESKIYIDCFEGSTVSSNGTQITPFCRDRNLTENNTLQVFENPTVTDDGNKLKTTIAGLSKKTGGSNKREDKEVSLKNNTIYLIRITEANILATDVGYTFCWNEN